MSILETYLANVASAIKEKKGIDTPINAQNFASEILSIQGGGSLNLAYGLTPPTDTSKIWLQCTEPQAVEVQNYLGECANYGAIANPVDGHNYFYRDYYNTCYIENNQIAIVGYNHIRIYDLNSKSYIADYTISVDTGNYYSNIIHKDNVLYFGYKNFLYSFDLSTQTLTKLSDFGDSSYHKCKYIFFNGNSYIDIFDYYSYSSGKNYHYRYNLNTNERSTIFDKLDSHFAYASNAIKVNNTVYNFYMYTTTGTNYFYWKYNLSSNTFTTFTSFYNFMTELGWTQYYSSSTIYDGERYIYLIGGTGKLSEDDNYTRSSLIIKYDTVNDSFELVDIKLISKKTNSFGFLIDNRIYMFGGNDIRKNYIDYFDLTYPLNTNNAIITTNTINTDNALPLINTDKLKLNSNIASAYKGNADNLAEKVNCYYHNGTTWKGINCEDYVESESSGTGGGLNGGGDVTTDPEIPVDKPVEI